MHTAEAGKKVAWHQWSSGRIHRCHRCDPGSIRGGCIAMHLCGMEHQLWLGMSYRDFDQCGGNGVLADNTKPLTAH